MLVWDKKAAGQPEIIRAHQKDEYFQTRLNNEFTRIALAFIGQKCCIKYEQEISSLSKMGYACATTAYGLQTIGEEYCHLLQVDGAEFKVSNTKRRLLLMVLRSFGPLITEKLVTYIQNLKFLRRDSGKASLPKILLENIQFAFRVLRRLHLAIFYLDGKFYEVSKTMCRIRYVVLRDFLKDTFAPSRYQILGKLLLLQVIYFMASKLIEVTPLAWYKCELPNAEFHEHANDLSTKVLQTNSNCPLCLAPLTEAVSTPCGHLFCWFCIIDWLKSRFDCPICRSEVQKSSLVYLC